MFGVKGYIYGAALLGVVSLVGYGAALQVSNARLRAQNIDLKHELNVKERQIEQAKEAEAVADAWASKHRADAERSDAIVEALMTGDFNEIIDQPLDPRILDLFDRLRDSDPG